MKRIATIIVFLILAFGWLVCRPATVTGTMHDLELKVLNTTLVFQPTNQVLISWAELSAGPSAKVASTNGAFSITLDGGDYTVLLPLVRERQPFNIAVPNDTNTYNITALMNPPRTYIYTNSYPPGGGGSGTNATIAVTNPITGAPGTQVLVTNLGNAIAAVLQFTIPAGANGAPGANGLNGTNFVTVQLFTNSVLQSQKIRTYYTNAAYWGRSNFLARVPGLYSWGLDEGNDAGNPPMNIIGGLVGSYSGTNAWFPITNGFQTTNWISVSQTNTGYSSRSNVLIVPGSAELWSVDHLELMNRTNAMFSQHFQFDNPQLPSDAATKGYVDFAVQNTLSPFGTFLDTNNVFHVVYVHNNVTVVDIASTSAGVPIDSFVTGGGFWYDPGSGPIFQPTNCILSIALTNLSAGWQIQTSPNLSLNNGWSPVANFISITTNSGEVNFTIPITLPAEFFRATKTGTNSISFQADFSGTNIQSGTISSNKLDAATRAMLGGGSGGSGPTNWNYRAITNAPWLTGSSNIQPANVTNAPGFWAAAPFGGSSGATSVIITPSMRYAFTNGTLAAASQSSGLRTALVAYWPMNENVANGARFDATTGGHTLIDRNTSIGTTGGLISSYAASVGSSGDELDVMNPPDQQGEIGTAWSVSMWIKDFNGGQPIEWSDGSGNIMFRVQMTAPPSSNVDFNAVTVANYAGLESSMPGYIDSTVWHHLVLTANPQNSQVNVYLDGASAYSNYGASTITAKLPYFHFGYGSICEVGLWCRELTSTEVTALYNSGSGLPVTSF